MTLMRSHCWFRLPVVVLLILLGGPVWADSGSQSVAAEEDRSSSAISEGDPVFTPGTDSGGAGGTIELAGGCRLQVLCVSDSVCRQLWQGFWACVWQEGSQCDSIWCESGE